MASASRYPCALCGASLNDEASFRRHLEDVHGFFDPGTDQDPAAAPTLPPAPTPAPPPAPTPPPTPTPPPAAKPSPPAPAPPPAADRPFEFDWGGPAPPVQKTEAHEHPWQEPTAFGLGLTTEAALAAGLVVAFFLPWFNTPGFLSSSGVGMLSWLPSRVHGIDSVVPYLAVLIPLGAVAVLVQWWRGEPTKTLATVTGALAPVVLTYALLRGQGLNLGRVLNVGAYLTIVLSVALLGAARDWWTIPLPLNRGEVSRRGLGSAGVALAIVVAALAVPVLAHQRTRSQVLAAFDLNAPATTVQSTAAGTQLDASGKSTSTTVASGSSDTSIPTVGGPTPTTNAAAVAGAAGATATTGPQRRVIGGSGTGGANPPSGNRPATTVPKSTPPSTAAPAAGGCPPNRPSAQISSFTPKERVDDPDVYDVDLTGTVRNPTTASIDLYSATIGYYDPNGDRADSGSVSFSGSLGPGQTKTWSLHDSVYSPDGAPHAAVTKLDYDWSDSSLGRCPT